MPRNIPESTKQAMRGYLGILPDADVAKKFNVSTEAVGIARREYGIKPTRKKLNKRISHGKVLPLLGKMTDADIAEACGVHPTSISGIRTNKGIPPYTGPNIDDAVAKLLKIGGSNGIF